MTYGLSSKRSRSRRTRRLSWATLVGLAGVTLLGATGCDTVARISFSERRFNDVQPVSFSSAGGQCEGLTQGGEIGFVLMASDNTPIKPGEAISQGVVNLDRNSFSFADGAVYSTPERVCASTDECPDSFLCGVGQDGAQDLGNRCHITTTVAAASDPEFIGKDQASHAFGVLVSRAGSWRGFLPSEVGALNLVANELTDNQYAVIAGPDVRPRPARATDNNRRRYSALSGLVTNWNNVASIVRESGRESLFGLWTYGGSSGTIFSHVNATSGGSLWTGSLRGAQSAEEDMKSESINEGSRNFLYGAILKVLDQGFTDARVADFESRTLVVLTDSPDSFQSTNNSAQNVITRANELGVSIMLVHVDPALDNNLLRDDFIYYQGKPTCASDDECRNYETCRQPQFFRSANNTQNDSIDYPGMNHLDSAFCLPTRDEKGRIGPVAEFQEIACSTGGTYNYVPAAEIPLMRNALEHLPAYVEAGWTVDVSLSATDTDVLFPGEAFRLQSVMSVDVGSSNGTFNFAQKGSVSGASGLDPAAADTRATFFTAE
ncbi:VWA domain-containing protein [Lujinxingia sediminis]|uniref:VWA domain-containing protein n=1 Tax=Lujinxingia sediminis TaxID=2480984 RepID=A0ABY0CWH2_9DELT|nr:vWA domain-containing protein [Lujinxingia sediminis]RVU47950.1 VWA domain-containing protein [Lujinxingia sediminis]